MVAIASVIERAKLTEYAQNEKAIADRLPRHGRSPISDGDKALLGPFINWCEGQKVRHCPASPAVVATFVREFNWRGPKILVPMMRALEALHDFFGISNPVSTEPVRAAVAEMFNDDLADLIGELKAPKSWSKNEKVLFYTVPREIQEAIHRRDFQREQAISRALNEVNNARLKISKLELELRKHQPEQKEESNVQLENTNL